MSRRVRRPSTKPTQMPPLLDEERGRVLCWLVGVILLACAMVACKPPPFAGPPGAGQTKQEH